MNVFVLKCWHYFTRSIERLADPCEAIQVTIVGPQYLCRTKLHHLFGSFLPSFISPFLLSFPLHSGPAVVRPCLSGEIRHTSLDFWVAPPPQVHNPLRRSSPDSQAVTRSFEGLGQGTLSNSSGALIWTFSMIL